MNIYEMNLLNMVAAQPYMNQRSLAKDSGYSLGIVNRSLKTLTDEGYLDEDRRLTGKAKKCLNDSKPRRAVILAAGVGMRMVPINMESPKALLEVKGERLIERMIRHLHEVSVTDISVVVGFMKEKFEYLIDEFGVDLIVNPDYAKKNNLHSLALVSGRLENSYIIPCDVWCEQNPFREYEMYSWYMVTDEMSYASDVRINRKQELAKISKTAEGNRMIGISYIDRQDAGKLCERLQELDRLGNEELFWEDAAYVEDKLMFSAREIPAGQAVEINTFEQLREMDGESRHLKSDAIRVVADALHVPEDEIVDIEVLKKGMTNRSFSFVCRGKKYIMRIPGEGTEQLINRKQEAKVYQVIAGKGLCDDPVYINAENGYKLTAFLDGVRVCDADDPEDLKKCMTMLRSFHDMKLSVGHTFDIFGQMEFYETLWNGKPSVYDDYLTTKRHVLSLKPFIEANAKPFVLTHIDANQDNFLFFDKGNETGLQLMDWEYAGMQDPDVDLAMFCIYSMYNRKQVDRLIDIYYEGTCDEATRTKIYCYIAVCGLLWSNWCEYKSALGVEFGEYSLRQYRFAKEYYKIVEERVHA
ncbi:MAG: NTP transferase domain-containing protein [Lachnospiraceae bacterium]|nr:NTP transferase domain-containing protein [Lachnospiraceae bacterium]